MGFGSGVLGESTWRGVWEWGTEGEYMAWGLGVAYWGRVHGVGFGSGVLRGI